MSKNSSWEHIYIYVCVCMHIGRYQGTWTTLWCWMKIFKWKNHAMLVFNTRGDFMRKSLIRLGNNLEFLGAFVSTDLQSIFWSIPRILVDSCLRSKWAFSRYLHKDKTSDGVDIYVYNINKEGFVNASRALSNAAIWSFLLSTISNLQLLHKRA